MIYSVQSNDPKNYSKISCNINIPWNCEFVKYYVSSVNMVSNILITTQEDFLEMNIDKTQIKISFDNRCSYEIEELPNILKKQIEDVNTTIKLDDSNRLVINSKELITITNATHRVKMLLGLYHTTFPISSVGENMSYSLTFPSAPLTSLGNKLYLVSLQGKAMNTITSEGEYTPSVLANIDSFIKAGLPLIQNFEEGKPVSTKINTASIRYLEVTLTDFMFHPVILTSPLFITLKIKPMKHSLSLD